MESVVDRAKATSVAASVARAQPTSRSASTVEYLRSDVPGVVSWRGTWGVDCLGAAWSDDDRGGGVGGGLSRRGWSSSACDNDSSNDGGEMFEQMPDDLPPKRIIRQLEEIREQNARILQLVEYARATKNSGGGSASAHGRALDR
jgi:hypothetical protein